MKYIKTFESFKLNESDYIQVDLEKLKNLDLDKESLFKLLRELIPDDEHHNIIRYNRKWGKLEDQGKSESECVKALLQDEIIKDVEFFQSKMTDPNERKSWKWGNVPDSILLKDEGEVEPKPEPINPEKEAKKKWDKYWIIDDGFYDIVRSLRNDDFDAFAKCIFTAVNVLIETKLSNLDSFKKDFDRLLTDSFSVLLGEYEKNKQHDSLISNAITDPIKTLVNKIASGDNKLKPY